ncbi:hypothetical protein Tco_0252441 [Tanacetum coccineum]
MKYTTLDGARGKPPRTASGVRISHGGYVVEVFRFNPRSLGLGLHLDYGLSKFFCVLLHLASKLGCGAIGKFYKVGVLFLVDDIDECHILLEKPCKTTITKTEVPIEDPKKAKDFRVLKNLEDEATEFEVIKVERLDCGRHVKKDEGSRVKVEHKSTKDMVRREKMVDVDKALNSENLRAISFQVKGNDGDKIWAKNQRLNFYTA